MKSPFCIVYKRYTVSIPIASRNCYDLLTPLKTDSIIPMKRKTVAHEPSVTIMLNGEPFECVSGESLASALLAAGVYHFDNHPVDGDPRGPFCMMGACQACVLQVDGRTRQACKLSVSAGQNVVLPKQPGYAR